MEQSYSSSHALGADAGEQIGHFEGRQGGFGPFVAKLATRPLFGLGRVLAGEDTQSDGDAVAFTYRLDSARAAVDHDVEVRRVATDHRAQGDQRRESPRPRQLIERQRNLPGTRNPHHHEVVRVRTMANQNVQGPRKQAVHDPLVETRCDQPDMET